jgi:hypothetical protein
VVSTALIVAVALVTDVAYTEIVQRCVLLITEPREGAG